MRREPYYIPGEGGGQWSVILKAGSIEIPEGLIPEPTVSVKISANDYLDIAVCTSGKIKIQADV